MKNSKVNVISSVQNSVSSIFSKEDVLSLINSIEETPSRKITTQDIGRAIDKTISWIDNNERDIFNFGDAEFEISYNNQLELVGVPVDTDVIREALENNFMDFGEEEVDEVVVLSDETFSKYLSGIENEENN